MKYIEYFKKAVSVFQDKIAVSFRDKNMSYQEIDEISGKISGKIHSMGIKKGSFVVILMEENIEYVASFLGILKAGCIAVPSSIHYPKDRIDFIVNECEASLIIDSAFFADIDNYEEHLDLADEKDQIWLIYTSGSTGTPKGIIHTQEGLLDQIIDEKRLYQQGNSSFASIAPFTFVAFIGVLGNFLNGTRTYIVPEEIKENIKELVNFYKENEITNVYLTPQMLKLLDFEEYKPKLIYSGGERLRNIYHEGITILNSYGASEVPATALAFVVDKKYENTPLGKPHGKNDFMLDPETGEIILIVPHKVEYFKKPDSNKLIYKDGKTYIRTGDKGHLDEDGNLIYDNRLDWMVKINGQRVDVKEVEVVANQVEGVDAVVKGFFDSSTYLVLFYVAENDMESEIKKHLIEKLAPYMIPRFIVKLDEFPRNFNGKLDYKSLELPASYLYQPLYIEPRNENERKVAKAFEIIFEKKIGVLDDFIRLGGDSIGVLKLLDLLEDETITANDILIAKTVENIAKLLGKNKRVHIEKAKEQEFYPLTDSQLGIYLQCVNDLKTTMYNLPNAFLLKRDTDLLKLEKAIKDTLSNHPALNVRIIQQDGNFVMQKLKKEIEVESYKNFDLNHFVRPFELEKGPLCRTAIVENEEDTYFVFDVHHLVFDGTSYNVFMKEIENRYKGNDCESENIGLFDESVYEANREEDTEGFDFFQSVFKDVDCDSSIVPDQITEVTKEEGIYRYEFKNEYLNLFAKSRNVTENTLFLTAFAYTLARFTGSNEAMFTSVNSGRTSTAMASAVGMFVRTIPLYYRFNHEESISEVLNNSQDYFFKSMSYSDVSFSKLASAYNLNVDISFVYQSTMDNLFDGSEIYTSTFELSKNETQSDIDIMVFHDKDTYTIVSHYRKEKYSENLIDSFFRMYVNIIQEFLIKKNLRDVSLVSEEAVKELEGFNQNRDEELRFDVSPVSLFESNVSKYPDNVAVYYEGKQLTYQELDRKTNKIAGYLTKMGVKAGDCVGILISKSENIVVLPLAATKCEALYMPIVATYPDERIRYMIHDAKPKVIIVEDSLADKIKDYNGAIVKTSELDNLEEDFNFVSTKKYDYPFIMLYTSGTTGEPKGVILNANSIAQSIQDTVQIGAMNSDSKMAAYASFGFDASMLDTYCPIACGGTLYVLDESIRLDLKKVKNYFDTHGITHAFLTTQVARQFAVNGGSKYLKVLITGGEKLTPVNPDFDFKLINMYGPTECSIFVTKYVVDKKYKDVPIGKITPNTRAYIMTKDGKQLPTYACGELYVSGIRIGNGYLNKPAKTNEVFSTDPVTGERMYKTGDVVRIDHQGVLHFVGRKDSQVKIRGFRIELTEVEEVVRRFPGVTDATIAAYDSPTGGKYIAAYVVCEGELDKKALADFIRAEKPAYMVPQVFMQLDKIPYTVNQKVNKRALPEPTSFVEEEEDHAEPTMLERRIFEILGEILGYEVKSRSSSLSSLGLSSLSAIQLAYKLSEAFHVEIQVSDFLDGANVLELENKIVELLLSRENSAASIEKPQAAVLSKSQFGIYSECLMHPESVMYNVPMLLRFEKTVGMDRLKSAIIEALRAHRGILSHVEEKDGETYLVAGDEKPVVVVRQANQLSDIREVPFDLHKQMYLAEIVELEDGFYVHLSFHHMIFDGSSAAILMKDLGTALAGQDVLPEEYTLFESNIAEQEQSSGENYQKAAEYFESLLDGCGSCNTLSDDLVSDDKTTEVTTVLPLALDASAVESFIEKHQLTENAFFMGVMAYLLGKYNNAEDVVMTTVYHGRDSYRLANTTGMFVKTLPYRALIDEEQSVLDYLTDAKRELTTLIQHAVYPFSDIARKFHIGADFMFIYQGDLIHAQNELGGYKVEAVNYGVGALKRPLTIDMYKEGDHYRLVISHSKSYSDELLQSFADTFQTVASGMLTCVNLKDLPLCSQSEEALLDSFNDTDYPIEQQSVNKLLEASALRDPNKTAVIAQNGTLSFSEFNALCNRVAHHLIRLGAKKDTIIGMLFDRTKEVFICEGGILKSGQAFLPMVYDYPFDRINYCLEDAGSPYLITSRAIYESREELHRDLKYKVLLIEDLMVGESDENPDLNIDMDALAYVIYTSGSTGKPKGVMIEHRNMLNYITPSPKHPSMRYLAEDLHCVASVTSIAFDMSINERFCPLYNGVTVAMASIDEIYNPGLLADMMNRNLCDAIVCTPSYLMNLCDTEVMRLPLSRIRAAHVGGEAFTTALANAIKKIAPESHIMNGYGPTETTSCSNSFDVQPGQRIPIGAAEHNYKTYVVDRQMRLLPRYMMGELLICGAGVGRGYVNLEEKTRQAFVTYKGFKAYHSGDLTRYNRDGVVEYFGRMDNQVKLRGLRIELDEIENVILTYKGMKHCIVVVRNNGHEDYLAGFFTNENKVDIDKLSEHLKASLPIYMVPAIMVQLDEMPLTANGKIDKKQLPEVSYVAKASEYVAPKNELETTICHIYEEILQLEQVSAQDSFFEIGGTSLSATKVVMKMEAAGYHIVYKDVFDHPSAIELAKALQGEKVEYKKTETIANYDYGKIKELLSIETIDHADEIHKTEVSAIILTGATGFLGIHVLRELLENTEMTIYCLLRGETEEKIRKRLYGMYMYYFGTLDRLENSDRVVVVPGDITDVASLNALETINAFVVLNCAACVKHFVKDDILDRVNVQGVKNLIDMCAKSGKKLVQISTASVAGEGGDDLAGVTMHEKDLYIGQLLENDYVRTKFLAERAILEAKAKKNLDACIIRVGNLMSRKSDGEFQINFLTNGFMRRLKAFATLGAFPVGIRNVPVEFSAIDETARMVALLIQTESEFTVFHGYTDRTVTLGEVVNLMREYGFAIQVVTDQAFAGIVHEASLQDKYADAILGLGAYASHEENRHFVDADNAFTIEALYQLGFEWSFVSKEYILNAIGALDTMGFFGSKEVEEAE